MDSEYVVELPMSMSGDEVVGLVEKAVSVAGWRYEETPCFYVPKTGAIAELKSYRLEARKGGIFSRVRRGGIAFCVSSDPDKHHDYPDDKIRRDGRYTALVMYGYGLGPTDMGRFAGNFKAVLEEEMQDMMK